jgi:hypothetical protein
MKSLKKDIKGWEHAFQEREGRKPTKQDIGADKEIAKKYKLYAKLKIAVESEGTPAVSSLPASPQKEKQASDESLEESKIPTKPFIPLSSPSRPRPVATESKPPALQPLEKPKGADSWRGSVDIDTESGKTNHQSLFILSNGAFSSNSELSDRTSLPPSPVKPPSRTSLSENFRLRKSVMSSGPVATSNSPSVAQFRVNNLSLGESISRTSYI